MNTKKITAMKAAGKILGEVLEKVTKSVEPGMTEIELDEMAERLIREKGGEPGFQKVPGYKHTICVSTNDVVVHGIPTKRVLKQGDIVGIDCGVYLDGYHTDMAETVVVGKLKDQAVLDFLKAGKEAMFAGIKAAQVSNRVGNISQAMQGIIEGGGYSVVRNLVGHGVGKELHEAPEIPGYLDSKIEKTPKLSAGLTIAVEIIYNMGKKEVVYEGGDDWTIVTEDGSLAGLFERTILLTERGPELITAFKGETL